MNKNRYDIFISYKRKSLPTANNLYYRLTTRGYSTFFDLEEMRRDNFNVQLLNHIENAKDVFVILEEGSLDACKGQNWETDWFCKEISFAIEKGKNIIPILLNGFTMPSEDFFPEKLKELSLKNAPEFNFSFFEAYLDKLVEKEYLLSKPNLQDKATSVFKFYSNENCQVFKEGKLVCSLEGMSDEPYYLPVPRKGDYRFKAENAITIETQIIKTSIDEGEEKEIEIIWGLQDSSKSPKERLLDMLSRASKIISGLNTPNANLNLAKLKQTINNDSFKISVTGSFSSGKSTFINAILGDKILPSNAFPTTTCMIEVKYGEIKKAVIYFKNPLPDSLSDNDLPEKVSAHLKSYGNKDVPPLQINYDELWGLLCDPNNDMCYFDESRHIYEKAELFLPCDILREGIEIIDTPGISEDNLREIWITEMSNSVDANVFIFRSDRLCGPDDLDFIQNYLCRIGSTNLFFVVNGMDLICDNEKDRLKKFAEMKLSQFTSNPIFYVSAINALEGVVRKDNLQLERSGIPAFIKHLTATLHKEKGKHKLLQHAHELKRILSNGILDKVVSDQIIISDESNAFFETAKRQLDDLKQRKENFLSKMNLKIEQNRLDFKRHIDRNISSICDMIPTWIDEYTPQTSFILLTKTKTQALVEEIKDHVNDIIIEQLYEKTAPLIKDKFQCFYDSLEPDLKSLYEVIYTITNINSRGNHDDPEKEHLCQSIASENGNVIESPDKMFATIKKRFFENDTFGSRMLGLSNSFSVFSVTSMPLYATIMIGAPSFPKMDHLKKMIGVKIVNSIAQDACYLSTTAAESFIDPMIGLSSDISNVLDKEICQVEQQLNYIIEEREKGQSSIDALKKTLRSCERQIKSLNAELESFMLEFDSNLED